MDDTIKTWLYDILSSINEIESYFIETPKMFEIYQNDFWEKAQLIRSKTIEATSLNDTISNQIFDLIHQQSLLIQEEILNQKNEQ